MYAEFTTGYAESAIAGMARDAGRRYYRIMSFGYRARRKWVRTWLAAAWGGQKSAAARSLDSAGTLSGEITLDGKPADRHTIRQLRGNTFSYVP